MTEAYHKAMFLVVLDELEREFFDVVLMDCDMRQMNGFQSNRALRRLEAHFGIWRESIIALSANAMSDRRDGRLRNHAGYHRAARRTD